MALGAKKRKDALCVIVGEGDRKETLHKLARKLRLEHAVSFIGSVLPSTVPFYMSAADVFVLPSLSEGKPNVVAEAMACGVPVVSSQVAGTVEIVQHGVNGLLVNAKKPEQFARALMNILEDNRLAKKLSSGGLMTVSESGLTWKACTQEHLQIYQQVL